MLGTFGGALEASHVDASNGKLVAEVTGEVETEEGVLVIRRIHVAMQLVAPEQSREVVERTHGIYAMRCPPSIEPCTTQSSLHRHMPFILRRRTELLLPRTTRADTASHVHRSRPCHFC